MLSTLFLFNDTATTEIYTLSLHDALPIYRQSGAARLDDVALVGLASDRDRAGLEDHRLRTGATREGVDRRAADRKSTRLNSSHANISYAVFCLKKNRPPHGDTHPNKATVA